MNKLNVFIYATCQGSAISKFLMESNEFNEKYTIQKIVHNYTYINKNVNFIDEKEYDLSIKNTDVFIYQPLNDTYGKNSTDYIKTLIKPLCKTISIPYIYNLSLWPLIHTVKRDITDDWKSGDGDRYITINVEPIDRLINDGLSRTEIIKKYDNNEIDFDYEIRHRITLNLLNNKEKDIDVKVHDYIKENVTKKRLFLYCSHPTSHIFVHMTNQILRYLDLTPIDDNYVLDFANIQSPIPIAYPTSSIKYFNFEFTTNEEEIIGNNFYKNLVINYLNSKNIK